MKPYLLFISLIIFSVAVFPQQKDNNLQSINFLSNIQHTGVFYGNPIVSSPEVKYFYKTGGSVRSTPAVYQDKIYFGSGDTYLYCIEENTGKEIWKFKTGGAVTSSPALLNDRIYLASKDGFLYCLNNENGKQIWKFFLGKELFYKWEFDYYLSSPTIFEGVVYIGSGDGNLYAVNSDNGNLLWKYFAGSRIRATPAISKGIIYFGDFAGKLYAIDLNTRNPKWIYETDGVKIKIEDFVFDRAALISSPTIYENSLIVGSREGALYNINIETGKLQWKLDYKMSWVISTPAIYKDNVIVGTSDGHYVHSVNIKTGEENWKFHTKLPVWSSVAIVKNVIYFGDYSGNFVAADAETGNKLWEFKTEDRIHSSPVVHNGVVFIGSDDGNLYAFQGSQNLSDRSQKSKKAVYWEESNGFNWFSNKSDEVIRDYFTKEGYELLDGQKLKSFFEERAKDHLPSVVVFARNEFPSVIINDSLNTDLLREYLKGDNKIVMLGENPIAYIKDKTGKLVELDYRKASKYFGIDYGGELTDAMKGLIPCYVTPEGVKIGLKGFWIPMAAVTPDQVSIIFAKDENGLAAAWLKNYGENKSSGFMQLWINRFYPSISELSKIKNAAEFGLQ